LDAFNRGDDSLKVTLFGPHARIAKSQRFDADEDLCAARGRQPCEHLGALADSPVAFGEIANIGLLQYVKELLSITAAGKRIVVGELDERMSIELANGCQLLLNQSRRLLAKRAEQPAGRAKVASQRATGLCLYGEPGRG
jgi:hypothetical protein